MLKDLLYHYQVEVIRVIDGDTFEGDIDLGFHLRKREIFRLADVDTPETWRPTTEAERMHGKQATAFVKNLIEGKNVICKSVADGKYGRYIVHVYLNYDDYRADRCLSEILIENDLQKRESYPEDTTEV